MYTIILKKVCDISIKLMILHFYRFNWKITLALIYLVDICYTNIDNRHQ